MNAPLKIEETVAWPDLADPGQCSAIESFVAERGGSLFHRPAWLKAVERGTGQRASGIMTSRLGAITGWLPLTEVRSVLFGNALVSSGFAVEGGLLVDSPASAEAIANAVTKHASAAGFASVELRGGAIPAGWACQSDKHCGFVRDLADSDEAQLLDIPRKARAEIRKGLKNDLTVRIGRSARDLADHYAVYSNSVRNLGTPVFPRALFAAMVEAFPNACDILTVSTEGRPVASVLSFYHMGTVMPYWGGGTYAARGLRANEIMYFELMLHARRNGCDRFDFGRSKTGSGPYKFKKNWGFEPRPLTYGEWAGTGRAARNIDPTNASYSRKIDLWKKLPLPIANAIGPFIARGLA